MNSVRRRTTAYADIIEKHPTKFHGLASLPAQNAELSVKELERSVKQAGPQGRVLEHERERPLSR